MASPGLGAQIVPGQRHDLNLKQAAHGTLNSTCKHSIVEHSVTPMLTTRKLQGCQPALKWQ